MRATRDTFLHFIADNLPAISVHNVRFDKDNPGSELLQGNAINVKFVNVDYDIKISGQDVVIDIVHENELTALDWTRQLTGLLLAAAYTPKYDYSGANPVLVPNSIIYWNPHIRFKPVTDPGWVRFNSAFTLKHQYLP